MNLLHDSFVCLDLPPVNANPSNASKQPGGCHEKTLLISHNFSSLRLVDCLREMKRPSLAALSLLATASIGRLIESTPSFPSLFFFFHIVLWLLRSSIPLIPSETFSSNRFKKLPWSLFYWSFLLSARQSASRRILSFRRQCRDSIRYCFYPINFVSSNNFSPVSRSSTATTTRHSWRTFTILVRLLFAR